MRGTAAWATAGLLQQHRLDLAQLDPVSADLDLGVDPPVVLDLPVGVHPPEIPGAVDAPTWGSWDAEEVGNESPLREVVPVDVAPRQPGAGDPDLSEGAGRRAAGECGSRITVRVGGQRDPEGDGPVRVHRRPGGGDRRLGGAVDVEEPSPGAVPAPDQVLRAGLARDEQEAQVRQVLLQRGEKRGDAAQRRDLAAAEEVRQVGAQQGRPSGLGTRVAPHSSGTQISSTEKSNAMVMPWYTRSPSRIP